MSDKLKFQLKCVVSFLKLTNIVVDPICLNLSMSRLRINGGGIFDVLSFDASNSPNAMVPHFQV